MTKLDKPVSRVTRGALDRRHGKDSGKRLVCTMAPGDLLIVRPLGTRRPETINIMDVYEAAIRYRVNCARLEKAREVKARKQSSRRVRR